MDIDSNQKKSTYTGTLIFCIIATVVTIVIILMFFFLDVNKVKYMLLTLEVCLILIIVHSIISIIMFERKHKKFSTNIANAPIANLACPDYFTRKTENGTIVCENVYETDKTYLTIGPKLQQIDLSQMNKKIASDTCQKYGNEYKKD